jgi:hypothetical protein
MWRVGCGIITPSSFSGYALIKNLTNIYERSYIETEYDVTMGGKIAKLKSCKCGVWLHHRNAKSLHVEQKKKGGDALVLVLVYYIRMTIEFSCIE